MIINSSYRAIKNSCNFDISLEIFETLPSTSTYLKEKAQSGAPSLLCAIAEHQSLGRGRMGRAFFSPDGKGIYMSLLLRPMDDLGKISANDGVLVTTCAAVAVSEAIKNVTGKDTSIKWINDLFLDGKKVCGILAEGSYNPQTAGFDYIVLGIGLNVVGNFDGTELKDVATALYPELDGSALTDVKNRLTAEILNRFLSRYKTQLKNGGREFFEDYKSRLFIIGKDLEVLQGESVETATVLDLNEDFTLKVRYGDGKIASLNSGEVRLRVK